MQNKKIILASASPRRKEILEKFDINFDVIPSNFEEKFDEKFSYELIENLAYGKAKDVKDKISEKAIIIASDTLVVLAEKILGKPKDKDDAISMLASLSGKTHKVVSAIAIIDTYTDTILKDYVESEVKFRDLSKEEIIKYVESNEPMDKAGAYAIQGFASVFVEKINGCYLNIVGISAYKLNEMLKKVGFDLF